MNTTLTGEFVYKMKVIAVLLMVVLAGETFSATAQTKEERQIAKIKQTVEKYRIDPQSKITAVMKQGRDIKGYVSEVGENSFVVTNPKKGTSITVQYADVSYINKPFPLWGKIAIGVGIAGAVVALCFSLAFQNT
jgi:hypothetical protein